VANAAQRFEEAGLVITHPWWNLEGKEDDPVYLCQCAEYDVLGVVSAHVLVVLNTQKSEGKAVEQGIAIAMGIPIVLIGEKSNIFHHLNIYQVHDIDGAIEMVKWLTTPAPETPLVTES